MDAGVASEFVRQIKVRDGESKEHPVTVRVFDGPREQLYHPLTRLPLLSRENSEQLQDGSLKGVCFALVMPAVDVEKVKRELRNEFPERLNLVFSKPEPLVDRLMAAMSARKLSNELYGFVYSSSSFLLGITTMLSGATHPGLQLFSNMAIVVGGPLTVAFGTVLGLRAYRTCRELVSSIKVELK